MRKAIKFCLALAMVGSMAMQGYAADKDVSVGGRVWSTFYNSTTTPKTGDATTVMDHTGGRSRVNVTGTMKGDTWSSKGFMEFEMRPSDTFKSRDAWVELENDSMAIRAGRGYWFGNQKGSDYLYGYVADVNQWIGEWYGYNDPDGEYRPNAVRVSLKDVGLSITLGINGDAARSGDTSQDGGTFKETLLYLSYGKAFGPIDLGVTYLSASWSRDENQSGAVAEGGNYDGTGATALSVSADYSISDEMGVAFSYESAAQTKGKSTWDGTKFTGATGDDVKKTHMLLTFDMKLDDVSGFTAGYNTTATADGSDNDEKVTNMLFNYKTEVGGALVIAELGNVQTKDDDTNTDTKVMKYGVTLRYNF